MSLPARHYTYSLARPRTDAHHTPHAHTLSLSFCIQVNKNVKVKARVGLDGVAAALVLRSWWQPSFTLGAAVAYDLQAGRPRWGLTLAIENWSALRWGRTRPWLRARGVEWGRVGGVCSGRRCGWSGWVGAPARE